MKQKLLFTTAIALVSATLPAQAEAYSGEPEVDLKITGNETLENKDEIQEGNPISPYYYKSVTVNKDGELTITNSDIKTIPNDSATTDIAVYGKLNLTGSVLESGNDDDTIPDNSDMLLDGANVILNNSDLEANGNMTIKGTTLNSQSDSYDDEDMYGLWADKDLSVSDSTITLKNSYLASDGKISITGGEINAYAGDIIAKNGDINISGGEIKMTGPETTSEGHIGSDIETYNGNITISDGTLTMGTDSDIMAKQGKLTVTGGTINLNSSKDGASEMFGLSGVEISGGTINVNGIGLIDTYYDSLLDEKIGEKPETSGNVLFSGGTINVADGGHLGVISEGQINLTAGELNIAEKGKAEFYSGGEFYETGGTPEYEMKNLKDATLNLSGSGTLNLSGEFKGNLEMSDNAVLNANSADTQTKINGTLNVKNGTIELNSTGDDAMFLNVTDGVDISGGTVTMNGNSLNVREGGLNISGGTINMNDGSLGDNQDLTLWAAKDITISGGTINMNGEDASIDTMYDWIDENGNPLPKPEEAGNIIITGGEININSASAGISSEGNIQISDKAIVNINSGAVLSSYKSFSLTDGDMEDEEKATINLANGGMLNLSGKYIGNLAVNNGGVVNVGESAAVVDGEATFNSGSTLKISVTDNGNGSLTADKITGNNGSKLALNVTRTMEIGDSETFDLLKGEVSNNFSDEVSNNRYKVTKDGGKYTITYENSASDIVADEGGSSNNASTAEAWDSMVSAAGSEVNKTAQNIAETLRDLSQNDSKAYVEALTAVAPEVAPLVQKTQTETANQVFSAVSTRLSGGSISSARQGIASGDNPFRKVAVWIQGLFNKSKLDDTKTSKGFNSDSYGASFGVENSFDNHIRAGIGYAYTDTDIDGFKRDTDVDTHTALLYGEYKPSNWFVNGIASYGWSDYSEKKNVAGIGVKADYDVETFGLQAMTGYEFGINGFSLTPEAGLRYVHISQDSYKDSAEQKISGNDSDILTGVIGAKVSKNFALNNGVILQPEFRLAATYDLKNDKAGATVTLANGSAYQVTGEALDRFGVEVGAGVTAALNDRVDISLGYEGKFRDDYQDHTGLINAKYKF